MKLLFQFGFLFLFCFSVNAAETFIITKNGTELGNGPSYSASISENANRIVFESIARNLVNDGAINRNIYLLDRTSNKFTRLSVSNSGNPGNANSLRADINSNGTLTVFESFASNLTTNSGSKGNIFLRDITNNITTLVSKTHDGSIPNGISSLSQISGDGKYIVFHSRASNLVPNDNNQFRDIFIFDVVNNSVLLISSSPDGSSTNGDSNSPSISDDGRYISYISVANNIDPVDDNNMYDVFLWDRETGTSELISKTFDGSPLIANNRNPYISGNGKYIAFISDAKNLVAGTNATFRHVFLYNTNKDSIILISKSSEGIQANNVSLIPKLSNNGRFVSYVSRASNLVDNDSNDSSDLFVYDTILGTTERVSLTNQGQQLNANIDFVSAINDNGEMLTFSSSASNLGSNNHTQINLRVRDPIPNIQPIANAGIDQVLLCNGLTTNVQLDASQSNDPDSDQALTYNWTGTFGSNSLMNPVLPLATGIHNINLQVGDNSGALDSDNVIISINDYTPPKIDTPLHIMLEATSSQGVHHLMSINVIDNCSVPNTIISINDTWFPIGLTDVNISSIDASGNTSSLISTIQVADTTPPILIAPENIIYEATSLANKIDIGSAQTEDIFPVTLNNNAPELFSLGKTDIVWVAIDANGNEASAVQNVLVQDTRPPILSIPANLFIEATSAEMQIDIGLATAADIFPVTISNNAPSVYTLGLHLITWTATDNNGNTTSSIQKITVTDTIPPTIITRGNVTLEASLTQGAEYVINYQVNDACNCGDINIDITPQLSIYPLGKTSVYITATDPSGNQSTKMINVIVIDSIKPILMLPANIIYEASAKLTAISIGNATAKDIFPVSITHNAPAEFPLGQTLVTWRATDSSGNTSIAVQEINIIDTTAPTFTIIETKNKLWPPNRKLEHMLSINRLKDTVDESPNLDINISINLDIKKRLKHHRYNKPFWEIRKTEDGWDIWLKKTRIPRSNENLVYNIVITANDEFGNIRSKKYSYEVKHFRKYSQKRSNKHAHKHHKMEKYHVKTQKHQGGKNKRFKRKYKKPHKYNDHEQAKKKKYRRHG